MFLSRVTDAPAVLCVLEEPLGSWLGACVQLRGHLTVRSLGTYCKQGQISYADFAYFRIIHFTRAAFLKCSASLGTGIGCPPGPRQHGSEKMTNDQSLSSWRSAQTLGIKSAFIGMPFVLLMPCGHANLGTLRDSTG